MTIKSDYASLDVKEGRTDLAERIEAGEKIPITIRGTIVSLASSDDGTSIEFAVDVDSVEETTA